MRTSVVTHVLILAMVCFTAEAVMKLVDTINVCKRDDPELTFCLYMNVKRLLPLLNDGVPEMNLTPMGALMAQDVKIAFTQAQSVTLEASLKNVTFYGLNKFKLHNFATFKTSNGIQVYLDLDFPEVGIKSFYTAVGNFSLVGINASSDFYAEITGIKSQSLWNSTIYKKNDKEHLLYKGRMISFAIEKIVVHFNNMIDNNTELNENINQVINKNSNFLYDDFKGVISDSIIGIVEKLANDVHATFPYDLLYPID